MRGVVMNFEEPRSTSTALSSAIASILLVAGQKGRGIAERLKDGIALASVGWKRLRPATTLPVAEQSIGHVLVVDDLLPDPAYGAGYPRAFEIVSSLVSFGYKVSVYPLESASKDIDRIRKVFSESVSFHSGYGWRGLRRLIWQHGDTFDVAFVSRPDPMRALVKAGWPKRSHHKRIPLIYDMEAVLTTREALRRSVFEADWSLTEYTTALSAEMSLASQADVVTAVSAGDRETMQSLVNAPVVVVSHCVSVFPNHVGFENRKDFLFIGRLTGSRTFAPNVDAVLWFVSEVMPVLDNLLGLDYEVHCVGLNKSADLDTVQNHRVVFHGIVDDLTPFYERFRVFLAPTRFAAGIPLKVVETMGRGLPCVATPLLAKQLSITGDEILTGETPEEYAAQCQLLYTDPLAWNRVRNSGVSFVEHSFSKQAFNQGLCAAFEAASVVRRPGSPL